MVLSEAQAKLPESTQVARVVAFRPKLPELPPLQHKTFDGRDESLVGQEKGPLLLTLWADWCAPCAVELDAFTRRKAELQASGVRILALNVEELDGTKREKAVPPEQFLKNRGFAFSSGIATADVVQALEDIQFDLIRRIEPLPIPTSFLIDSSDGRTRVAIMYKGPVTVDQVLAYVQLLNADPAKIRTAAVPFSGRWSQEMGVFYQDQMTVSGILAAIVQTPALAIPILVACCLLLVVLIRIHRRRRPR